jgi:autotransporter-associated beta strand protein
VTLVDGLQLNSDEMTVKYSPREIRVVDNPASASDGAVISGVLSGTKHNDLLKTGEGTLELSAVNTLAGAVLVQGGTLNLSGSLPNSLATGVLSGATLTGGGSASRLLLGSGGTVAPGTGGVGTLSAAGCVWRAGGLMRFELASASNSSDRLALGTAALQKGDAAGPFAFDFGGTGANGFTYTLATFGSTTFSPSDFTATGLPPQVAGTFQISGGNTLHFVTVAPIEFWRRSWFGPSAVNAGSSANGADPDSDGLSNLEEYALGSSPLAATASAGPVSADGAGRLAMVFSRNPAATDVTLRIESSTTLAAASWTPEAVWSQAAGWTVAPGAHISENAGAVTFIDSVLLSSQAAGRRCLRLRVSQP